MKVVIAGGGTGGHLYPGIALAEEFVLKEQENIVLFVGTKEGLESRILPQLGFNLKTIESGGMKKKSLKGKLSSFFRVLNGMKQSFDIMKDFSPDLVIGTGGYVSFPLVLTAFLMKIKTAICEQNSLPGTANRILGKLVNRIFVSFEESQQFFSSKKIYVVGNPVRKALLEGYHQDVSRERKKFSLLVMGGSQGAHEINLAMIDALYYLGDLKEKLQIIHQSGDKDYSLVFDAYQKEGIEAEVEPFIDNMAKAYHMSDLVICRAGATTISELMVYGKPSLLIPYSHAVGDHQTINGQTLRKKGAARMIASKDLSGQTLGKSIRHLYHHPGLLKEMGEKTKEMGKPGAAKEIVDICYRLVA